MNVFEDEIIEKSIKTKGNALEIANLFFDYVNDPNFCKSSFTKTLIGNNSAKILIFCAQILDKYYFMSNFEYEANKQIVQISTILQNNIAHLIYSSYLRDLPLVTEYFNDLGVSKNKIEIINYADALAIKIYKAKNYFEKVILCSPQTSDWYYQRTLVAHIIEDFLKNDEDCVKIDDKLIDLDGQRLYCITFRYNDKYYFWIDVLTGTDVHCSHLETINGGKIDILFASEAEGRSFIPTDERIITLSLLYHKVLEKAEKQNIQK